MPFFDLPSDDELTPEVRQMLREYNLMLGHHETPVGWRAFADSPRIVAARLAGFRALFHECSFPWETKNLAWMLIAHAKGCRVCFAYSRTALDKLGWDEATLSQVCANPETLPLRERDRAFVQYALRTALGPVGLRLRDFKEMEARGLSKSEICELLAFAACANMHMTFTLSQVGWLGEE
jgi:alkylhydroperoxidase family enzyme